MPAMNVYYDVATKRLDAQMEQIDLFDTKAATLFASASGILAIFAGLLALTALPPEAAIKVVVVTALGLACLVYVVLLILLFAAYKVGVWDRRPHLDDLRANCATHDEQTMQEWVANECMEAVGYNTPLIERKASLINWALRAFPVEALLLVIAGAITLLAK